MHANGNSPDLDPSQMSMKEKLDFFEKGKSNYLAKSTSYPNVPSVYSIKNVETTSSERSNSSFIQPKKPARRQIFEKIPNSGNSSPRTNTVSYSVSCIVNNLNKSAHSSALSQNSIKSESNIPSASLGNMSMKEFHEVFRDLDSFISKELNEIEQQKRLSALHKDNILKNIRDSDYDDKIMISLQKLKEDICGIKENQKCFEEKMRKHELNQIFAQKKNDVDMREITYQNSKEKKQKSPELPKMKPEENKNEVQYAEITTSAIKNMMVNDDIERQRSFRKPLSKTSSVSSIVTETDFYRNERIKKLEVEIYKEETLMMKINRVLESVKKVDDRNLVDIINIERHYLVASTRFQSALSELRKLKENKKPQHMSPNVNRKGKLFVREIMLEVKSSYFDREPGTRNEFLIALMKYEDKVYATKPVQIRDDIRIVRFTEKFSVPECYMDFEMRLEIFGTTFWRKNNSVRDTMLKKYGFITFSLVDTGSKAKRFTMIEVLQSDNVPIRSKIMMKISQKITTDVKYKGPLSVKLRDVWYDATARLVGHILEFTLSKKLYSLDHTQSQETMSLDLYNTDCDAVIPVDSRRLSERPFAFLLKFNHYIDVTNFYIMMAADDDEYYAEWVAALNKVLALIK